MVFSLKYPGFFKPELEAESWLEQTKDGTIQHQGFLIFEQCIWVQ